MTSFNESVVEEAALEWFGGLRQISGRRGAAIFHPAHDFSVSESAAHLADTADEVFVPHRSPAEETWLETAWYAAVKRHPEKNWPHPNWFDFLSRVVQREPVVVHGSHGFGLKPVTKAMHAAGLIDTEWGDGPTDGLGAMIGAWWCAHEAERVTVPMLDFELMQQIRDYNEVDCRAMLEIVQYLRREH